MLAISRSFVTALLMIVTGGCTNLLSPESGLEMPKDPGTVLVRVVDEAKRAIVQVKVTLHVTNNAGSPYMLGAYTGINGITFAGVPAGVRRAEIDLPAGFKAPVDGLARDVEVVKDRTTVVEFVLTR